jgi:hypothetical protein
LIDGPRVTRIAALLGLLVVGAAGLVVATGSAFAGTTLTKAEFIEQADQICSETDQYLGFIALGIAPEGGPDDAQLAEFAQYLVPAYEDLITQVRALEEPPADRAKVKKFLQVLTREVHAVEADPTLLREGVFPKASKLAQRYGFTACGTS